VGLTFVSGSNNWQGASTFSGSLMLVGNGAGITSSQSAGVLIKTHLTTSNGGDITLVQTGTTTGAGIFGFYSTLTAGGALTMSQLGSTGSWGIQFNNLIVSSGLAFTATQVGSAGGNGINSVSSTLTSGTATTLIQSGNVTENGINVEVSTLRAATTMTLTQSGSAGSVGSIGINTDTATLTAATSMNLTSSGSAGLSGIYALTSTLRAGSSMTLTQSGSSVYAGIYFQATGLTAGGDLSLLQSGNSLIGIGILFSASGTGANQAVTLAAGINNFVTLKTNNQKLGVWTADNFSVLSGRVRIDLGTGKFSSSNNYTLKATGLDVFYTGATSGNSAKIAVGSGSFTFVNDRRSVTGAVTLTDTTTASTADSTNGWDSAPTYGGVANARTLDGLTITGSFDTAIQGLGVVYGGAVTIQGIGSSSPARDLRYIEGTGVAVTTASTFSGNLTLVGSGAGITSGGNSAGVLVVANLTTSNGGNLSLHQTGAGTGTGILVNNATLSAGGALTLTQSGSAGSVGIYAYR
ncbi:MAG: hypothetical protein ORO03_02035, partial [Alphaproteobacteria bacterium]|nr:hypothetical protein [Alphaproteobacteria bacterium]